MNLHAQLNHLQDAGLIQLVQERPELEYLFRHALVQDAAYGSMLHSDRGNIHQRIGETLESLFADNLNEVAGVIGHHFLVDIDPVPIHNLQ